MTQIIRKTMSLVLTAVLVLGMTPAHVFAEDDIGLLLTEKPERICDNLCNEESINADCMICAEDYTMCVLEDFAGNKDTDFSLTAEPLQVSYNVISGSALEITAATAITDATYTIYVRSDGLFDAGTGGNNLAAALSSKGLTYDTTDRKLIMNNFNFTTTASTGLKISEGTIIDLTGTNSITGGNSGSANTMGVDAQGMSLAISGDGSLAVTAGNASYSMSGSIGIQSGGGSLVIKDSVTLTVSAGNAGSSSASVGIVVKDFTVQDSVSVAATGKTAGSGMNSSGLRVTGTLNMTGGTVTADGLTVALYINSNPANVSVKGGACSGESTDLEWNSSGYKIPSGDVAKYAVMTVAAGDGAPDGSESNPFTINNEAELTALATAVNSGTNYDGKYFLLTADIALTSSWTPIGTYGEHTTFNGTFNGNGKSISGLSISRTASYQGLFGYIGAGGVVKNLGVSGNVAGNQDVGGIAGQNGGTIENCYFSGNVSGSLRAGGISGWNTGIISNCYNTGDVSVGAAAGGITGLNSSTVANCYNTGNVTGEWYVGGIVGQSAGTPTVKDCVSLGAKVTITADTESIGRVFGTILGKAQNNQSRADLPIGASGSEAAVTSSTGVTTIHGADVALNTALSSVFSGWSSSIWSIPASNLAENGALPTLKSITGSQTPTLPVILGGSGGDLSYTLYFKNGDSGWNLYEGDTTTVYSGNSGKWTAGENTLTLNGFNFETTEGTAFNIAANVTITLTGTNSITGGDATTANGILSEGTINVVIQGDGSLTVNSGNANSGVSAAVRASGTLTIGGNAVLKANAGTASLSSNGIYAFSRLIVKDNAVVTANANTGTASYGINAVSLTMTGSTITASSKDTTNSAAIYTASEVMGVTVRGGASDSDDNVLAFRSTAYAYGITVDGTFTRAKYAVMTAAGGGEVNYILYLAENGTEFTKGNDGAVVNLHGFAWDNNTKTLTLTNFNFATETATAMKIGQHINIVLVGNSTIKGGNSTTDDVCGIDSYAGVPKLTFSGSGSLTVTAGNATGSLKCSYGILANEIEMTDTAKITGNAGEGRLMATGIFASSYLTIAAGTSVTGSGGANAQISKGVFLTTLEMNGGTLTAKAKNASTASWGLDAQTINFTSGTVTAECGTASDGYCAIIAKNNPSGVTVTGGANIGDTNTLTLNNENAYVYGEPPTPAKYAVMTAAGGAAAVSSIAIKAAPAKIAYTAGEALDLTGLVVTLKKSDSSTEDVAFDNFGTKDITTAPANGTMLTTANTSVTITYTADNKSVNQAINVNAAQSYTVTVNGSYAGTTGAGSYTQGTIVTIYAGSRSAYSFKGWKVNSGGVTLANASSAATTFTMPASAVAITANWSYNGGSSDGGDNGGGLSGDSSTPTPEPDPTPEPTASSTPAPTTTPDNSSNILIDGKEVSAGTVEAKGDTVTVTVNQETIHKQLGTAKDNVTIVIPADEQTGTAVAQLVVKNVDDMASKRMTLTVQVGNVQYELPTTAIDTAAVLAALGASNAADVPIDITVTTNVSETVQAAVNNAIEANGSELVIPPMEFRITATYEGKTVEIDTFSQYVSRSVEITEEQAQKVTTAIIVDLDGTTRHVPTRVYQKDGKWYAEVNSLTNSIYALVYNEKTFADAKGKWYETAVNEMASRMVISGVGEDSFAGERDITRAEFAAIIVKALGLPTNGNGAVFTDVSRSAWYCGALGTAYEYGIVSGVGDNKYDPNKAITRQEAMIMVQRAAKLTGFKGSRGNLDSFIDAGGVSIWAIEAAIWNVGSGLVSGYDGRLNPLSNITRAETATLVLSLLQKSRLVDVRNNKPISNAVAKSEKIFTVMPWTENDPVQLLGSDGDDKNA